MKKPSMKGQAELINKNQRSVLQMKKISKTKMGKQEKANTGKSMKQPRKNNSMNRWLPGGVRGESEFEGVARQSKLLQFLSPTRQKRIYLLLLTLFLGISFAFLSVGSQLNIGSLVWIFYWALIILSFPSFLLWQSYGLVPLSQSGIPFAIFSILMQFIWLYIVACSLTLVAINWKKVEK
jgi:hypothetical protein